MSVAFDPGGGGSTTTVSYLNPVIKVALQTVSNLPARVATAPTTKTFVATHPSLPAAHTVLSSIAPFVSNPTMGFTSGTSAPAAGVGGILGSVATAAQAANWTPTPVSNLPTSGGPGVGFDQGPYVAPTLPAPGTVLRQDNPPPAPIDPWQAIEDRTHTVQEGQAAGVNSAFFGTPNPNIPVTSNMPPVTPPPTSSPFASAPSPIGAGGTPASTQSPQPSQSAPIPIGSMPETAITQHPVYQQVFGTQRQGTYNAYGQQTPIGTMYGAPEDITPGPAVVPGHVQYGPELTGLSGYGGAITPNGTPTVLSAWQRQQLDPTSLTNYGDYAHSIAGWNPDDLSQYSQRISGNLGDTSLPKSYAPISVTPSPYGG